MLKPKIYETDDIFFNIIKEIPIEEENKEVQAPEKERPLISSFDLGKDLSPFFWNFFILSLSSTKKFLNLLKLVL